ncbi:hypothetical protein BDQ17DRAFT_1354150 [Cyathus striatus]|nr:hypothetical protein BDQ17DRAFT_1354150 [Cyathus striatus]
MASMLSFSPFSLGFPLITALIIFIQLLYPSHAWTLSHAVVDNDLTKDCNFSFDGRTFDLCTLVGANAVQVNGGVVHSVEGDLERVYQISLDGRSHVGKSVKTPLSCSEDTWVCMIDQAPAVTPASEGNSGEYSVRQDRQRVMPLARRRRPPSVLVDEGINAHISLHGSDGGNEDLTLNMFLIGGHVEGTVAQYASIDFQCNYNESEGGHQNIQFKGEYHGVHSFVWISRHACPVAVKASRLDIQESIPKEDSEKEDKEGDDLLDPHGAGSRVARKWIATIVLLAGTAAIITAILITSPSARHWTNEHLHGASYAVLPLLHRAGGTLKPVQKRFKSMIPKTGRRFRQGESRLVQWAQEDMTLNDIDVMVNEVDENNDDRWDVEQLDEYIPLKMSPRWSKGQRSPKTYGTTEITTEDDIAIGEGKRSGYWFKNFLGRS